MNKINTNLINKLTKYFPYISDYPKSNQLTNNELASLLKFDLENFKIEIKNHKDFRFFMKNYEEKTLNTWYKSLKSILNKRECIKREDARRKKRIAEENLKRKEEKNSSLKTLHDKLQLTPQQKILLKELIG